jgi:hypothetical protein
MVKRKGMQLNEPTDEAIEHALFPSSSFFPLYPLNN